METAAPEPELEKTGEGAKAAQPNGSPKVEAGADGKAEAGEGDRSDAPSDLGSLSSNDADLAQNSRDSAVLQNSEEKANTVEEKREQETEETPAVQKEVKAQPNIETKSWDDIGKRLVEARKALDVATKADEKAAEELTQAQKIKQKTTEELRKRAELVHKLAREFTEATEALTAPKVQMLAPRIRSHSPPRSLMDLTKPKSEGQRVEFDPSAARRRKSTESTGSPSSILRIGRSNGTIAQASASPSRQKEISNTGALLTNLGAEDSEPKRIRFTVGLNKDAAIINSGVTASAETNSPTAPAAPAEDPAARLLSSKKKPNPYGRSLFRGVRKVLSDGSFESRISVNGQDFLLGRFAVEEEAARAYDDAVRKHRTPKDKAAILNFPTDEDRHQGWRSTFELSYSQ